MNGRVRVRSREQNMKAVTCHVTPAAASACGFGAFGLHTCTHARSYRVPPPVAEAPGQTDRHGGALQTRDCTCVMLQWYAQ